MGLIKAAIYTSAGIYAVNKLSKSAQQSHAHCQCHQCTGNRGPTNNNSSSQGPPREGQVWYPYPPTNAPDVRSLGARAVRPETDKTAVEGETHPYFREGDVKEN